jgi:hypothetical protein
VYKLHANKLNCTSVWKTSLSIQATRATGSTAHQLRSSVSILVTSRTSLVKRANVSVESEREHTSYPQNNLNCTFVCKHTSYTRNKIHGMSASVRLKVTCRTNATAHQCGERV